MNVTSKDLKFLLKSASNLCNSLSVLNDYCYHMQEYESITNLYLIMKYIHNESDKLYFNLPSIESGANACEIAIRLLQTYTK